MYMISGSKPKGFTIVETMIFLAVSAALLTSALALISGSQNKSQFSVAMNDVQQEITKVINNVTNGYYPSTTTGKCVPAGGRIVFTGVTQQKGTNKDCSFIGRVVQFSSGDTFKVYSIAGMRKTTDARQQEVSNMTEALSTALPSPDVIRLKNGISVKKVTDSSHTPPNIGAVGFFTGFGTTSASDGLQSGTLQSEFIGIVGSSLTTDASTIIEGPAFRTDYSNPLSRNPANGITICFDSGTTSQHGRIIIGGQNKKAVTTMTITDVAC